MSPGAPLLARETRTRNPPTKQPLAIIESGGPDRDRTDDLLDANQALSQLSYGPICRVPIPQPSGASIYRMIHWIMLPLALRLVEMEPPTAELRARKKGRPNTPLKDGTSGFKKQIELAIRSGWP